MLMPFEWAVLTLAEARLLMNYIETSTATKGLSRNYEKIQKAGMLEIYNKLREFVEAADHYAGEIRTFNPDDYARDDHEHDAHRSYH